MRSLKRVLLISGLLLPLFISSLVWPETSKPLHHVAAAQGTEVYLSDLAWASATNGWGPVERDMSNGETAQNDGRTITLNGVPYAKGLGAHAHSEIVYNLGGSYSRFISDVGLDDETAPNGTVVFQVYGDGVLLYSSGVMNNQSATQNINVSVAGIQQLKLVITDGADNNHYDHADWAAARLVPNQTGSTTYLSDVAWTFVRNGWGPVEKDRSNGHYALGDGATITLNGVPYAKGLGAHADSEIIYNLGGNSSSFISDIGIDDEVGTGGAVRFQVFADGVLLYDSGVMTGSSQTQAINVSVAGRQQLRLLISAEGDPNSDHANWAGARVIGNTPPAGPNPAILGQWGPLTSWPIIAVHAHLLPNGKVLIWDADVTRAQIRVWDPATNTFTGNLPTPNTNVFCSGHSFLADGRLLVAGGQLGINYGPGSPNTNIFDFNTNTWTQVAPMGTDPNTSGRWYPSNVTLGSGEVLTLDGTSQNGQSNTMPQVWQNGTWRNLTGAAPYAPSLYPWLHVTPDGRVFVSGPSDFTKFLNTAGAGSKQDGPQSSAGFRDYGSSVMYADGKVMIVGGGGGDNALLPPTETAELINLDPSVRQSWVQATSMAFKRRQHNATVLPDGKVLITGGSSRKAFDDPQGTQAVYAAELWDPEAGGDGRGRWTTLAPMRVQRVYHSTALLLPDGRVLSAGGGQFGGATAPDNHPDSEIFSPPYLFMGARPAITGLISRVAGAVDYSETFTVQTPNAASISKVTWISLGSVTHAFNENQHLNRLSFSPVAGGLRVTAPSNRNLCPPGYYMLFILNSSGVPSVARIVRVGSAAAGDVYLSDLAWASATNGWGPVERDMSNGETAQGDGRTITLNGVPYAKGLGAHAASDITYNLGGAYSRFISDIGLDDETEPNGTVTFLVYVDGVLVYNSGVMNNQSLTQALNVSVAGAQQLRLVITDAGDNNHYDHADWAAARLVR